MHIIYFGLYLYVIWSNVKVTFFHMHTQCFFNICWKRVLPQWITLAPLLKSNCPYMCTSLSRLSIHFLFVYTSILLLVPHYLDDCTFVVIYKVRQFENSKYVILFLCCLGYSNPLYVSKCCRSILLLSSHSKCCVPIDQPWDTLLLNIFEP